MGTAIDLKSVNDQDKQLVSITDVRRLIEGARSQDLEQLRPISIHINLGDEVRKRERNSDKTGFDIRRSKLFWFVVILALSAGSAYARTRFVCQSFKDEGRFFYGMSVNRCIGALIKEPLATIESHLATLNGSY